MDGWMDALGVEIDGEGMERGMWAKAAGNTVPSP